MDMIGTDLEKRLKFFGLRSCGGCVKIRDDLDSKSAWYVLRHAEGIAASIDGNLRDVGWRGLALRLIPGVTRRRWLARQLRLIARRHA